MATLQHVALNCRDRKKQEAFYAKRFGFRRARVFNAGAPDEFVMLRLGEACLELFSASTGASTGGEPLTGGEQPVGFKHLAFGVDDLDKVVADLQADGIETGKIADCGHVVEGLRVCFFNDPEGNRLELMQGYQDESTE